MPQDRTIKAQVEEWEKLLRASVAQKLIDPGRLDAYQRHIRIFAKWAGIERSVDVINAVKLEQFWTYLAEQVAEERWSPSYARVIFMTFKQFASRLAEVGLIPLPWKHPEPSIQVR